MLGPIEYFPWTHNPYMVKNGRPPAGEGNLFLNRTFHISPEFFVSLSLKVLLL